MLRLRTLSDPSRGGNAQVSRLLWRVGGWPGDTPALKPIGQSRLASVWFKASDYVVIPFTADDSSRRAIENVIALLYGVADPSASQYARISFAKRAGEEGISPPKLHTFISNRVTMYEGRSSKAFEVSSQRIKKTVSEIYKLRRSIFAAPSTEPTKNFMEIPDHHSACIVAATTGTPLHKLKPGPHQLDQERIQINAGPLNRYKAALAKLVDAL